MLLQASKAKRTLKLFEDPTQSLRRLRLSVPLGNNPSIGGWLERNNSMFLHVPAANPCTSSNSERRLSTSTQCPHLPTKTPKQKHSSCKIAMRRLVSIAVAVAIRSRS